MDTFKLVLDYAGLEPNPARDRCVKLPRQPAKQPNIPSRAHIHAIRTHLPSSCYCPSTCLRRQGSVSESSPPSPGQTWTSATPGSGSPKTRPARPDAGSTSPQPSPTRSTPPGPREITPQGGACSPPSTTARSETRSEKPANTPTSPHYHPRDRWISLALKRGMPPAEVAQQAGHARQAITLDTYSHVITDPDDNQPLAWETHKKPAHPKPADPVRPQPPPNNQNPRKTPPPPKAHSFRATGDKSVTKVRQLVNHEGAACSQTTRVTEAS